MKSARRLLATVLLLLATCGQNPLQIAGGTTDTGNPSVIARVRYPDGSPAAGAKVVARPADYRAPVRPGGGSMTDRFQAVTDRNGHFRIDSLAGGLYRIEVNDEKGAATLFEVRVDTSDASSSIDAGEGTLRPYATVTGTIDTSGMDAGDARLSVQVYGLERLVPVGADGSYRITDLPEGRFRLQVIEENAALPPVQTPAVEALAEKAIEIPAVTGFAQGRRVYVNTSAGGADIVDDVHDFPLLIRLRFSELGMESTAFGWDGADIRFVKADGTVFPHEIEVWDAEAGTAAIWVKIDTLFAQSDSQFFWMRWGSSTENVPRPTQPVFGSQFAGVWHLGDTAVDGTVKDASVNGNNGILTTRPGQAAERAGIAGRSLYFRRPASWQDTVDNVKIPDHPSLHQRVFSVSAWMKPDTLLAPMFRYVPRILSTGNGQTPTEGFLFGSLRYDENRFGIQVHVPDTTVPSALIGYEETAVRQWIHVCATIDERTVRVYRNGRLMDEQPLPASGFTPGRGDVTLGHGFEGRIDEVRMYRAVVDAAWVKLSYECQREGASVVSIGR
jgi:hypothetical protein